MHYILQMLLSTWYTLCEMAPYLLFGFAAAGFLSVFLSPEMITRHLGGKGIIPVLKSSLFGIPLPLCSCSVIPVTVSLRKSGASKPAAVSFLLSTPQTGVDSVFVTYSLLGLLFAVFRPLAALFTGVLGGILVRFFAKDSTTDTIEYSEQTCHNCSSDSCTENEDEEIPASFFGKVRRILSYSFITLPRDLATPLLIGVLIAGLISVVVPDDFFASNLDGGLPALLLMMLVGIPLYVCSTASVPIAAALIAKGLSPGAALVFLITGAATNAAGVSVIWKTMGARTASLYLLTVAVSALSSGYLLNQLFSWFDISVHNITAHSEMLPDEVKVTAAIVLCIILTWGIAGKYITRWFSADEDAASSCCHQ